MSEAYTITLSLPPNVLSPNSGRHGSWRPRAKAKKAYRYVAKIETLWITDDYEPRWPAATVRATFYFKDRRRRDKDNFNAMLKPAWDGLVDAGLLADDDQLTHLPTVFELDKENPRVELRVERNEL